jgi:hypothetical protein
MDIGEFLELEAGHEIAESGTETQRSGLGCFDCSCCCEGAWWAGCWRCGAGFFFCQCPCCRVSRPAPSQSVSQ